MEDLSAPYAHLGQIVEYKVGKFVKLPLSLYLVGIANGLRVQFINACAAPRHDGVEAAEPEGRRASAEASRCSNTRL